MTMHTHAGVLRVLWIAAALLVVAAPRSVFACACGCGIFEVGTNAMFPQPGGMFFLEYDFQDQNQNWHGTSSAPSANNADKDLRTHFVTAGVQYMFNRSWGIIARIPFAARHFRTTTDEGDVRDFDHTALGDIRLEGIYSGFSADMSTGVVFGVSLPTGDYTFSGFDRDTEIGSGATKSILGAYHLDGFSLGERAGDRIINWFVNSVWERALLTRSGYRPGDEVNTAAGLYYDFGSMWNFSEVAPVLQLVNSDRWRDSGAKSNRPDTGYVRLFITPGLEIGIGDVKLYADVGFPIYENMYGNQLVAHELFRLIAGYHFA